MMRHTIRGICQRRRLRLLTLACLALPALAACGGGGGSSSSTLSLGITDGPVTSASSVVVSFTGVELQPSGGGKAITFNFTSPKTIDLLKEQNGNEASLLSGASVPAGNYQWIRLLLNVSSNGTVANSYITVNGSQYPLVIPSGAQTGLKLVQGFTMAVGQQANFTVDFMLQQSITDPTGQATGATQDYFLKPALRLVNNQQVGTISGTVSTSTLQSNPACLAGATSGTGPLPNAQVYIFSGSQTSLSSSLTPLVEPEIIESSSGYSYSQAFLPTGSYTVAVACTSTSSAGTTTVAAFLPANGTAATVTANQTTTVDL